MTDKTKKLVILSPGFPANEADTTCLPAHQVFIGALNKNFPEIKLIIIALEYPYISGVYEWFGNRIISFNGQKGKAKRILLWLKIWKTLKKIKKENDVIGLLSFWCGECALIGKYFGKENNIKHYCWITGQEAKKGNPFIKLIRPQSAELIAMSDFLADEFYKNYYVKPKYVIPNGIDISLFSKKKLKRILIFPVQVR